MYRKLVSFICRLNSLIIKEHLRIFPYYCHPTQIAYVQDYVREENYWSTLTIFEFQGHISSVVVFKIL